MRRDTAWMLRAFTGGARQGRGVMRKFARRLRIDFASKRNLRSNRGAMSLLALAASLIVILLGAISFDLFLAREQFNQLQAATDAAALSAAVYLTTPTNTDDAVMRNVGLSYFQKNYLINEGLSSATLSASVATDTPDAGNSELNIVNNGHNYVTATSVFGLQPTLLKFLGTFPLRATSIAGPPGGLTGDICIVMDLSDSLWCNKKSGAYPQYKRTYYAGAKKTAYSLTANAAATAFFPATGPGGSAYTHSKQAILDPAKITFTTDTTSVLAGGDLTINPTDTPLMHKALKTYSDALTAPPAGWTPPTNPASGQAFTVADFQTALLAEASAGNLENQSAFAPANAATKPSASSSVISMLPTGSSFTPAAGYKAEYQLLALTQVQPRAAQVSSIYNFQSKLAEQANDIHYSACGFGHLAGGTPQTAGYPNNCTLDPANVDKFCWPFVDLDQSNNNAQKVMQYCAMGTLSDGTDTPDAIQEGINILNGPGHRPNMPKTMILMTDGMPTKGGSLSQQLTQQFGQSGIRLIVVGFFGSGYAYPEGSIFCQKLASKVGNGAVYVDSTSGIDNTLPLPYTAAEIQQAKDALNKTMIDLATKPVGGTVVLVQQIPKFPN